MTATALPAPAILTPFGGAIPTGLIGTAVGSDNTFTLNGAGDKIAIIFQSPGTTVPDLIAFHVSSVSVAGTAGNIEATLETLDTSGNPSGTPVTNSATGSSAISTTGVKTISGMAGTAAVVRGTSYAVVLTAGAGWDRTLTIKATTGSSQGTFGFPYYATKDSAGSWTKAGANNLGFAFGLANSGGTYFNVPGLTGAYSAAGFQSFASTTNPDERGNRFVLPVPASIIGVLYSGSAGSTPGANDGSTINLYSGHTGTPTQLATQAMDGDAQGPDSVHIVLFDTEVALSANTTYAISLEATGTDTINLIRWDYASNAHLGALLGTDFYSTTANDAGAFTDDSAKLYAIFPIFSKFDDGAGGSSGGGIRLAGRGGLAAGA